MKHDSIIFLPISNLETAIVLLEHGADPHLIHPIQELTPLQILLRKASTINENHLKVNLN